ncbi:MAG: hypothetical protein KBF71_06530, partial [Alphaproteobacteria bacterium]|nr:hypothetical protein [Alphaproteobacteria bacterium]
LDALTLFPHAREVNVSASHQAFETSSQEDALCLKELLSSQLEKLAIPHDVSSSVLRMLIDVGLVDMIVDLAYKSHYHGTVV